MERGMADIGMGFHPDENADEPAFAYIHKWLWSCREHEIERIGRRVAIHITIVIGLFASYWAVLDKSVMTSPVRNLMCIAVATVGGLASLLWICMAKAANAWYDVYERAIHDIVSASVDSGALSPLKSILGEKCPIVDYSCEQGKTDWSNGVLNMSPGKYSLPKINIATGHLILLIWVVLTFGHIVIAGLFDAPFCQLNVKGLISEWAWLPCILLPVFACALFRWYSGRFLISDSLTAYDKRYKLRDNENNGIERIRCALKIRICSLRRVIVSIVVLAYSCLSVQAATWYVAANGGSDSNDGKTEATAFATIQKAYLAVSSGDEVVVDDGTYDGFGGAGKGSTPMVIRSKNGYTKTFITGGLMLGSNNLYGSVVVHGFTIGNATGGVTGGTLKSCRITGFKTWPESHLLSCSVQNCIIDNNSGYQFISGGTLRNCTIYSNSFITFASAGWFLNCVLSKCSGALQGSAGQYPSFLNCVQHGSSLTGSYNGTVPIINPLLVDPVNGDFRIQSGSPCVDAGNNSYASGDYDIAGNPRIYNGTVDIGAYEWKPKTPAGIENVVARQRYPWNGLVDLSFTVTGEVAEKYDYSFVAKDVVGNTNMTMTTLLDEKGATLPASNTVSPGTYRWAWNADADLPDGFKCDRVTVTATVEEHKGTYMVVDLSGGPTATSYPVSYLDTVPSGGWTDEYKTTKLVMRRIQAGTYLMQKIGEVTLTRDFYLGVFEVTQKQYSLVTGGNPTFHTHLGECRPVEVLYNAVRGSKKGMMWPTSSEVDDNSFMGNIRQKTGLDFDLPTEAQWEYACRAGTESLFNNGGSSAGDIYVVGRYRYNSDDGKGGWYYEHTTVGSYLVNNWGLYDMHGNISEWCLDFYAAKASYGVDPVGPTGGGDRVIRGGNWWSATWEYCTSYYREGLSPEPGSLTVTTVGFRLAYTVCK